MACTGHKATNVQPSIIPVCSPSYHFYIKYVNKIKYRGKEPKYGALSDAFESCSTVSFSHNIWKRVPDIRFFFFFFFPVMLYYSYTLMFSLFTALLLCRCVSFCSLLDAVCLSGNKRITYLLKLAQNVLSPNLVLIVVQQNVR